MSRFQFRLKTLLDMRAAKRADARAQLAESLNAKRMLEERKAALHAQLEAQRRRCRRGLSPGHVDLEELLSAGRYEVTLRAQFAAIVVQEESLTAEIIARQQSVAQADGEVRALEKLRAGQLDKFRQKEALASIRELDEVAARKRAV